jgi:ACDE family multidrug resistance protein
LGNVKGVQVVRGGDSLLKGPMKSAFALLCVVPFLMVLGNSMLFPIFPRLQAALHVSEVRTSLIITAFSVPAGLLIPVAGYLSDRFGRKPVMVPCVALFGAGALLAGLSAAFLGRGSFTGILVGRVVQGMGAAGMAQLAIALTADIFQSQERSKVLGLLEGANGLGKVVSPIAGAAAGLILWWLPFYVFVAIAWPAALGIWLFVHEPRTARAKGGFSAYVRTIASVFRAKGVSLAASLLAGGVLFFVLFGTLFYLSEVLEKGYHLSQLSVGFILALPVAAMSVGAYAAGAFLQRRQGVAKTAVWTGLTLVTLVMAVNAFGPPYGLLLVSISCLGLGAGAVIPSLTLLIASASEQKERGLITSLYGGVRFFGVAIGPPVFGLLMRSGQGVLFGVAAAVALVTAAAALWLIRPRQMLQPGGGTTGSASLRPEPRRPRLAPRLRS